MAKGTLFTIVAALVIASAGLYLVAAAMIPRLYLPDRFTRFSMAVLLILWLSHNWSRFFETFRHAWVRRVAVAVIVVLAAGPLSNTFRQGNGAPPYDERHARWTRSIAG